MNQNHARDLLKHMLESTSRLDTTNDPPSPLREISPESLDIFFARIDAEMALGNVPRPEDRNRIIEFYRSERIKHIQDELAQPIKTRRRTTITADNIKSLELFTDSNEPIE